MFCGIVWSVSLYTAGTISRQDSGENSAAEPIADAELASLPTPNAGLPSGGLFGLSVTFAKINIRPRREEKNEVFDHKT